MSCVNNYFWGINNITACVFYSVFGNIWKWQSENTKQNRNNCYTFFLKKHNITHIKYEFIRSNRPWQLLKTHIKCNRIRQNFCLKIKKSRYLRYREIWSWRWDSNPRSADYESAALPSEPLQQAHIIIATNTV